MNDRFEDNSFKKLLEEVRYNDKTIGKPLSITDGEEKTDKRRKGSLFIFDVMCALGYFDKAKMEATDDPKEIFNSMVKNAKQIVDDRGISL